MKLSLVNTLLFVIKISKDLQRSKTIGEDYTEDILKERLNENLQHTHPKVKKRVRKVIDIEQNEKTKTSKGYEFWAKKHNLKTMAESVIAIRELGINSKQELEIYIEKSADERQKLLDEIQIIESKMDSLAETMEHVENIRKYR